MKVVRKAQAQSYAAVGHTGVTAYRLQGLETSHAQDFWIGLSIYEPGGVAEWGMSDTEKAYVVLDGELTVTAQDGTSHVLLKHDSCLIEPREHREVVNVSGAPATLLVIASSLPKP
jgi:quercetin dioxygenase-like cupin family protein